jgi:hypothetical protein
MANKPHGFDSHEALEKGKYAEIRKFINNWLLDQTVYCNNCGLPFFGEVCCDKPEIGKNLDHCWAVIIQNKARRLGRGLASNQSKTMRLGLSIPVSLLYALEKFSKEKLGEKLFVNQQDMRGFMRAFPQFTICERI